MTDKIKIEGKTGDYEIIAEDPTTGTLTLKKAKSKLVLFTEGLCPDLTKEELAQKIFTQAIEIAAKKYREVNQCNDSKGSSVVNALRDYRGI